MQHSWQKRKSITVQGSYGDKNRERGREREGEGERETTQTDRQRQRQTETQTDRQSDTHRDTKRETEIAIYLLEGVGFAVNISANGDETGG